MHRMSLAHYHFTAKYKSTFYKQSKEGHEKIHSLSSLSFYGFAIQTTAAYRDCLPWNSFAQLRLSKSFQVLVKMSCEVWGISTKGELHEGKVTGISSWKDFGRLSSQSRITDEFSCGTNSQKYLPAEENKITDL